MFDVCQALQLRKPLVDLLFIYLFIFCFMYTITCNMYIFVIQFLAANMFN